MRRLETLLNEPFAYPKAGPSDAALSDLSVPGYGAAAMVRTPWGNAAELRDRATYSFQGGDDASITESVRSCRAR